MFKTNQPKEKKMNNEKDLLKFKKNKIEKMSVYKGVGVCKGVLKSGVYIERKLQQKYGVYPHLAKQKHSIF